MVAVEGIAHSQTPGEFVNRCKAVGMRTQCLMGHQHIGAQLGQAFDVGWEDRTTMLEQQAGAPAKAKAKAKATIIAPPLKSAQVYAGKTVILATQVADGR